MINLFFLSLYIKREGSETRPQRLRSTLVRPLSLTLSLSLSLPLSFSVYCSSPSLLYTATPPPLSLSLSLTISPSLAPSLTLLSLFLTNPLQLPLPTANKDVSFGRGGTQEEIIFGMSPELHIAPLFACTMSDCDSLLVTGAHHVGDYRGYGLDTEYVGPFLSLSLSERDEQAKGREIVMMDALNLYEVERKRENAQTLPVSLIQLSSECMERDLIKCFAAFSGIGKIERETENKERERERDIHNTPRQVATGHWGCGAFGGNRYFKIFLQWISLSFFGHSCEYYCFGDSDFSERVSHIASLSLSSNHTVSSFLSLFQKACDKTLSLHTPSNASQVGTDEIITNTLYKYLIDNM